MKLQNVMFFCVVPVLLLASGCGRDGDRAKVDYTAGQPANNTIPETADSLKLNLNSEEEEGEDGKAKEETAHEGFAMFPYSRYFFI